MKLGTHVHYTKTSKFSYSAKPGYVWGGCGGHFPKWPLSQKLIGAEPSTLTVYIGFVRRRFQKKYCKCTTPLYLTLWKPFYKMAAISKVIRLSQKLRGTEPSMLTLYTGFVGCRIQKKVLPNTSCQRIIFFGGHFTKMATIFKRNATYLSNYETEKRHCPVYTYHLWAT